MKVQGASENHSLEAEIGAERCGDHVLQHNAAIFEGVGSLSPAFSDSEETARRP